MLCYKLLKKIFITGLLIVATVPHDYRKRYIQSFPTFLASLSSPRAVSFSGTIAKSKSDRWSDKIFSYRSKKTYMLTLILFGKKVNYPRQKLGKRHPLGLTLLLVIMGQCSVIWDIEISKASLNSTKNWALKHFISPLIEYHFILLSDEQWCWVKARI